MKEHLKDLKHLKEKNNKYMKVLILLIISLVSYNALLHYTAHACQNNVESIPVPLYALEFAKKIGIPKSSLGNMHSFHIDIKTQINNQGLEKSLEIATAAIDNFNEKKYYLIINDDKGARVMRYYVLSNSIISLDLFFMKNETGKYIDVIYSEHYIEGINQKREEQKKGRAESAEGAMPCLLQSTEATPTDNSSQGSSRRG
jgi:hypothetical protein